MADLEEEVPAEPAGEDVPVEKRVNRIEEGLDRLRDVVDDIKTAVTGKGPAATAEPEAEPEEPTAEPATARAQETSMEAAVREELSRIGLAEEQAKINEHVKKEIERPPRQLSRVTQFLWGSDD